MTVVIYIIVRFKFKGITEYVAYKIFMFCGESDMMGTLLIDESDEEILIYLV
jgi:hypothetical protein